MAPSRTTFQWWPSRRTIVLARMPPVSPASRTSGRRSPNCFTIWVAAVQLGKPERLALVPVMGAPTASMIAVGTGMLAQRRATRPVLPVTFSGRRCVASTTRVSAPGQNLCARVRNESGTSRTNVTACSMELTRMGSALVSGRPFTRKTASMAARLKGSAARP